MIRCAKQEDVTYIRYERWWYNRNNRLQTSKFKGFRIEKKSIVLMNYINDSILMEKFKMFFTVKGKT